MSKIGLIVGREFNVRVRKRSFIVMTILMPVLMVALMVVPALVAMYGGGSEQREIIVCDASGIIGNRITSDSEVDFLVSSTSYPEVMSEHPNAYGYLTIGEDILENTSNAALYTKKNATIDLQQKIERTLSDIITQRRIENTNIEGLGEIMKEVSARASLSTFSIEKSSKSDEIVEKASSSGVYIAVSYLMGFVIYMFIFIYGTMVLNGVVEEKSNRIIEVIVSSVKPFELMMGKILGVASVAILQFVIWVVLIGVGSMVVMPMLGLSGGDAAAMGGGAVPAELGVEINSVLSTLLDPWFLMRVVGSFLIFFIGGYLLYASMFAAIGSAVDNAADTQQLQLPVTVPLIISLVLMMSVMRDPYSELAFWGSIIPFSSPIIMMARVSYGVPWWEFALSVVMLYGSFFAITYFASKIYRVGIFMYGKKPTFKELFRWIKY